MSIEQLAKLLGSSVATISRIETGQQDPQPQMMRDIIRLSNGSVTASALLGLKEDSTGRASNEDEDASAS